MRKMMSANEAASRSEEVKAQYCDINAYNDFMEMLADEIKIAVNNGWTSTMPLRWGYLPDGYANKVITELSELGYKVNTVEDKMTVSWYDRKLHKYESGHSIQTNRLFEKKAKQTEILRKMSVKSSWEDLKNAADNGTLEDMLESGDQIPVTLKDGRGILLDVGRDASGKFYFICHDCIAECQMNRDRDSEGGWRDSDARAFLNTEILALFPDDIQAAMKATKIIQKLNDEISETEDKLFLLSATQVFGSAKKWLYKSDLNDSQIDIFITERNRVKEVDDNGTWPWWLRSPYHYSGTFCRVNAYGTIGNSGAHTSIGVAPAFCIE